MRNALCALVAISLATSAGATDVPFPVAAPPSPPPVYIPGATVDLAPAVSCDVATPADTDLIVLSTPGQAGSIVPFAIGETRSTTRLVSVSGQSGRPVALVLTSGHSTVWDLRGVAPGRIKAVFVYGTEAQGVIGVPASVPIAFSDRSDRYSYGPSAACRHLPIAWGIAEAMNLAAAVNARFGRYPTYLFAGRAPVAFDLDGRPPAVPESVDVKQAQIRTAMPLRGKVEPPFVLRVKRLVDEGRVRLVGEAELARLRASGVAITPVQPLTADMMADGSPLPTDLDQEIRQRLRQANRRRLADRQTSYLRPGIVVMQSLAALPTSFGESSRYDSNATMPWYFANDVPLPEGAPRHLLFRLAASAAQLRASMGGSGSDNPLRRQLETIPGGPIEIKATWNGDLMTVRMPSTMNGQDRRLVSSPDLPPPVSYDAGARSTWWLLLGGLFGGGLAGWFVFTSLRRRPASATPPAVASSSHPACSLELVADPGVKAASSAYREEVMRIAARQDLEPDLDQEANAIRTRSAAIAERYLASRSFSLGEAGSNLDARIASTLNRLTAELAEIRRTQDERNLAAMDG